MLYENKSGSRFIVDLGDIKLSHLEEKQVENRIQAIILDALAKSEVVSKERKLQLKWGDDFDDILDGIWDHFPDFTAGMWIGRKDRPPVLYGPGGQPGPIFSEEDLQKFPQDKISIAREHTRIVRTVMEQPLQVLRKLQSKSVGPLETSRTEMLNAVAQAKIFDQRTQELVELSAKLLPQLERAQQRLPVSTSSALDQFNREIRSARSVDGMIAKLRAIQSSRKYDEYEGLSFGIDVAIEMLEDGKDTIYSPDFAFYSVFGKSYSGDTGDVVPYEVNLARDDTAGMVGGATTGFVGGSFGGPAGTLAGAAGGAIVGGLGASTVTAAKALWDYIWD